jgi:hypothetical protein
MWSIKSIYSICSFLIVKKMYLAPPLLENFGACVIISWCLPKAKTGERGCNKISSGITYVTTLDLNVLPIEPTEARKAFKRTCGF